MRARVLPFVLVFTVLAMPVAWTLLQTDDRLPTVTAPGGTEAPSAGPASTVRATSRTAPTPRLATINVSDPDAFANAVAELLFTMDTRAFDAEDHRALLMAHADPLMSEAGVNDLRSTVDERIPDETQWARMHANRQWSHWSPVAVWEPETWTDVVTEGLAEPGWAMRNVTGTQTTHYVDTSGPRTAVSEPTVTIAMRCPAAGIEMDRCHLTMIGTAVIP